MEPTQNSSLFQLNLDAQNSYTLRSAASWAKVLGIVGLIIGILCIILGILVQQVVTRYDGYEGSGGFSARNLGNAGLIAYVLMGLMFIISSIFALNAGNKVSAGLRGNDQASLNSGFAGMRNYFAFWAVISILFLLLLVITVIGNLG